MRKLIIVLAVTVLSGCATYSELDYTVGGSDRIQYDRHQDNVQNRTIRQNNETRTNIFTGLALLGSGYGVYNIERSHHERSKYRSLQRQYSNLLRQRRLED